MINNRFLSSFNRRNIKLAGTLLMFEKLRGYEFLSFTTNYIRKTDMHGKKHIDRVPTYTQLKVSRISSQVAETWYFVNVNNVTLSSNCNKETQISFPA